MKLSIVVPCYNEEGNVEKFYETTKEVFKDKEYDYEVIFINDGSNDKTDIKLKTLMQHKESYIKIISFSRNFGKEAAILAGLKNSLGDLICVIDADLQQRPQIISDMVTILDNNEEIDCVAAYQKERKEKRLFKFMKSKFYKIVDKVCDVHFFNGASDFRTFRRNMCEAILSMPEYFRFSKGLYSWVGFETKYIDRKSVV